MQMNTFKKMQAITFQVIANEYFQKNASDYFISNSKRILSKKCKCVYTILFLLKQFVLSMSLLCVWI